MDTRSVLTFGQWLKLRRKTLDLTQSEIAFQIGCSVAAIKKIESSERRPSRQIAGLLAEHLQIQPEQRAIFVRVARGELPVERLAPGQVPYKSVRPTARQNPPTQLVGREHELTEITHLLKDPGCRLLTLTGPGGIGKTRLALEVANQLQDTFAGYVYLVPLASISSAEYIIPAIAEALEFTFSGPADPKIQLFKYLHEKQALLVLDNLEHLFDGLELVSELLQVAPGIKLLATSRHQLRIQAEWAMEIQGLPVPHSDQAEVLENNSAAQLFVQRARQAQIGFTVGEAERPALAAICQLVQGLPLGIELAAAWTRTLSCQEIRQEIALGLDFLATNARDVTERHRSITAVFDHSWKLLSPDEQRALMRMSLFRGGFRREAAEQVAGAGLLLLSALVDKSLVHRQDNGRYDLHELVRQYAAAHLSADNAEEQAVRQGYSRYYLTLLQGFEAELRSPRQKEALGELNAEMDNIRRAWDLAITTEAIDRLRCTARSLYYLYELQQNFREAETAFKRAAELLLTRQAILEDDSLSSEKTRLEAALGDMLNYQAFFNLRPGNNCQALALFQASLDLLQPLNETYSLAFAYVHRGVVHWATGEFTEANQDLNAGLNLSRGSEQAWLRALALGFLGGVAHDQGDYPASYRWLSAALDLLRELEDPYFTLLIGIYFSRTALAMNRLDEARNVTHEGLRIARQADNRWGMGLALERMAVIAQASGELEEAHRLLEESVALHREIGDIWSLAWALNALSRLAFAQNDIATAEQCALETLKITAQAEYQPSALESLATLAAVRSRQGVSAEALEMTLQVLRQPACTQDTRERALQMNAELAGRLTPQQIEAAHLSAQAIPFDQFTQKLLNGDHSQFSA